MSSRSQSVKSTAQADDSRYTVWIYLGFLVFRSLNVLGTSTFFQPDEFYQSLEPAWQLAFGPDSGAWITWEWKEALRSSIHPLLFAGVYKLIAFAANTLGLGLVSRADLLVLTPKLFQVLIASIIDLYTYKLARIAYGNWSPEAINVTVIVTIGSPWAWYCSLRSFSNTLETALTIFALAQWPWQWTIQQFHQPKSTTSNASAKPGIDLREILENGGKSKDFTKASKKPSVPAPAARESAESSVTLVENDQMGNLPLALSAAALACILRPTNIVIWIALVSVSLYRYGTYEKFVRLSTTAGLVGLIVLFISLAIDRVYYGQLVFPQAKFLYVNTVQSISSFYGQNRIDYYLTEGVPLLLTTMLPFGIIGLWRALRPGPDKSEFAGYYERQMRLLLAFVVIATIIAFSSIAHKEARFIYPLLPILNVLAARPFSTFFHPFPIPESTMKLCLLIFFINVNVYIMTYLGLVHQRGVMGVIDFLRHQAETANGLKEISVGFLMPCHSTAWRSRLVHSQIKAWALTCEPPLNMSYEQRAVYVDEADKFYMHPGGWLADNMQDRKSILQTSTPGTKMDEGDLRVWPDHLVYFEQLEPVMNAVLDRTRYTECWRGFNSHWHDDWRRRGDVIVQCLDVESK